MSAASAEESPATAVSAGSLPERLAQRGSEPLGVIDVRLPQQHYARMAGWFGQRLPLLNQLLTRYHDGGEYGTGTGSFVYRTPPSFPPDMPTTFNPVNAYSPAVRVARPIPVVSMAVAGNDRLSSANTVFSATAVTGSSAAPPELAPSTFAQQAGLTPSPGSQLGGLGIAHFAPAAITGHDHHFGQEEPGLRFASRGAINRAPTPAPSRLRHYATYGPNDDHGPITRTAATVSTRPLPERLAQRGSEPLGVIDAHQPQQHYTRAAGWLGQRLPLLNQLLTRHHDGEEQRTGAGNFVYRAAPSFPPDMPNAFISGASSDLPGTVTTSVAQLGDLTPSGKVSLGRVGIAHPTPAVIATAAGTEAPGGTTATVAQPADLTPSGKVSLGRVGIAHPTPAVIATAAGTELPEGTTATVAQSADLTPSGKVSFGRVGIAHPTPAVIATAAGTESPGGTTATVAQPADLAPSAAALIESLAAPPAIMTLRVRRQAPPLADAVSTLVGKTLTETTADGRTGPAAGLLNQSVAPSPLPSDATMENRPAATLPLATGLQTPLPVRPRSMARPLAGAKPIAGTKRLPELQPTTAGPEPVIARKAIGAVSSTGDAGVDATPTAGALDPTRARLPDSMPLARRTSTLQLSESITGTADKPALPVILEKPVVAAADRFRPGLAEKYRRLDNRRRRQSGNDRPGQSGGCRGLSGGQWHGFDRSPDHAGRVDQSICRQSARRFVAREYARSIDCAGLGTAARPAQPPPVAPVGHRT